MKGIRAAVVLTVLLCSPTDGNADEGRVGLGFWIAPAAVSVGVTTIIGSLVAYNVDTTRRYPLLKSYLLTALMSSLGAVVGGALALFVIQADEAYVPATIAMPVLFGTATIIWLYPSDEPEDSGATRPRADRDEPLLHVVGVSVAPLNEGLAASVVLRF
jgi:hypothetical protein